MRFALALCAAAFVLAGCAGMSEYHDTNAAVDANPMCVSRPDRPGEPVSRDCERRSEGSISSRRESQPVDFRKDQDD
ncbi:MULTISPECIES: hypothetical protein [unclassified Luteimonas]